TCSTTKTSPFPTSPSSNAPQQLDRSTASDVWLTLAAAAYNLTRAVGHLASVFHAKARTGTIRRHLIHIPARIATRARTLTLHLPQRWRWEADFTDLWTATGQRLRT
ncbi:hypothetical protein ACIBB8_14620, partial [Streptomyces sp. NPDC051286]